MKAGFIVEQSEIKHILAEHFNVPEDNVIQSKYSFFIVTEKEGGKDGQ